MRASVQPTGRLRHSHPRSPNHRWAFSTQSATLLKLNQVRKTMRHLLVAVTLMLASQFCVAASNNPALHKLFADEWERSLRREP